MDYRISNEGWFHPGATKPNFNTVDVRTSQETPYEKYITSNLNPGIVFWGPDLEFNSNIKYFYTDRNHPKKRLTEAEMVEINGLYRIIGRCEDELNRLLNPPPTPAPALPMPDFGGDAPAPAQETPKARGIDPDTGHLMVGALGVILAILVIRRMMR